MNTIDVTLAKSFKFVLVLIGFFTCGIGALGMWFTTFSWPKVVDDAGVKTRSGKFYSWGELTRVVSVTVVDANLGRRITGRAELEFGNKKVKLVPQSIEPAQAVMDFISKKAGQKITTG